MKLLEEIEKIIDIKNLGYFHNRVIGCSSDQIRNLRENYPVNLHEETSKGLKATHIAACYGRWDMVQELLTPRVSFKEKSTDRVGAFRVVSQASNANFPLVQRNALDINALTPDGRNVLHFASEYGHFLLVAELLKYPGLDVHLKTKAGLTAVHLAVKNGHLMVLKQLLAFRAIESQGVGRPGEVFVLGGPINKAPGSLAVINVNSQTNEGFTALHLAAQRGDYPLVRELLECPNIDVHLKTKGGATAAHIAAECGHLEVIKLLARQINVNSPVVSGFTVVHLAVCHNRLEVVQWLLQNTDSNINAKAGLKTVLHWAVSNNNLPMLRELLKHAQLLVDEKCGDGLTPLAMAVCENKEEAVQSLLLAHPGIDVNWKNKEGSPLLHMAICHGFTRIAIWLLAHSQMNLTATDRNNQTALHWAVLTNNPEIVLQLLSAFQAHHIHIDGKNYRGSTALHIAVEHHLEEVMRQLLCFSDDSVNATRADGSTPLSLAIKQGASRLVAILLQHPKLETGGALHLAIEQLVSLGVVNALLQCPKIMFNEKIAGLTPLHLAVRLKKPAVVLGLLRLAVTKVNEKTQDGLTALHIAMQEGCEEIVSILLQRDELSFNEETAQGLTALHIAASCGFLRGVQALCVRGGLIINKKAHGRTALHMAAEGGYPLVVIELLAYNMDINEKTPDGMSPLHLAIKYGHLSVVNILLQYTLRVNEKNNAGQTPLYLAIRNYQLELARSLLLRMGVSIANSVDTLRDCSILYNFSERLALKNSFRGQGGAASFSQAYIKRDIREELIIAAILVGNPLTPWQIEEMKKTSLVGTINEFSDRMKLSLFPFAPSTTRANFNG